MKLSDIKARVLSADATAEPYESSKRSAESYTVWREVYRLPVTGDDRHSEGWAFQVDRFTKDEDDAVASTLISTLDGDDRVAVAYNIDYEPDTGYIHHIFDCEGC